jgi:callose synthase
VEASILEIADLKHNTPLEAALAGQALVQLGILMLLPMVVEIGLESGFWKAVTDFFLMQLQLASVFFTFSLGTKTHYFGRAILHGGSKSQPAKRSFVVKHVKFAENYRLYSRSHFTKALEILILLVVYSIYGKGVKGVIPYLVAEFSMWFLVVSWLFSPFFFNPSGFEWQKMVEDWDNWNQWMKRRGGIGVPRNKSWESWWNEQQEHLRYTGIAGCLWEVLLSVRFLLYQYGLVYHLDMVKGNTEIKVSYVAVIPSHICAKLLISYLIISEQY